MIFRRRNDDSPAEARNKALDSAIVLRDCSLRPQTSHATRRACRTVMREQAITWRRTPAAGAGR
jgi:hypothetical protein